MIALHLSILGGVPCLWGETARDLAGERRPAAGSPAPFPRDPGVKGLGHALQHLNVPFRIKAADCRQGVVWLPARGGVPEPSSAVLGPPLDARRPLAVAPFQTTLRPLELTEYLDLCALVAAPAGGGVLLGPSLAWSAHLLELALACAIQGDFLPGLVQAGPSWQARWLALPDEALEQRLVELVAAIPASCRCLAESGAPPPETPPALAVRLLLAGCLDALVRLGGASLPAAQPPARGRQRPASLHAAWLAALFAADAELHWPDARELREFAAQLRQWQRPLELTASAPFRFCFRLREPQVETDSPAEAAWQVEYLLQAKDDPSLLVNVGEVWNARGRASRQMEKHGGNPTEFLLSAMGQAAGISPGVAASLKQKHPGGFALDTAGAFTFLRTEAEALREAGFRVLLPSWWVGRGPTRHLALRARTAAPKLQGSSGLSLETMVDFDLCAALGGEELSLPELRELAKVKAPLLKVRGQWTQIDPEQLRSALRFLEKPQRQSLSGRDLLTMALGAEQQFGGLAVDSVDVTGWLRQLLDALTGQRELELVASPRQFTGQLRPYQQRGLSWLAFLRQWGLGACLADDMGLGKTVQTLALLQREREGGEQRPALLVCPTTVVNNWRKEAAKFTPELKVLVHHGSDRHRHGAFAKAASGHALVISSYGLLHRDSELFQSVDWAGVILDEAQNIKNPQTRQFKAARAIKADFRIALTGTPVENHVGDLWALMDFLNPGLLGSQNAFRQNFHRPIQFWRDAERAARLKALTGPFLLRRLKTDRAIISDLPDKIESREFCTLSREQASLYQAVLDDLRERLEQAEGMERRGLVLATLSKLKQVCNHPAHFLGDGSDLAGRSGKLARLEEILTEIRESRERTLIFTQFAEMGSLLQRHLQEWFGDEVLFLHGGVARKRRDEMVERFQQDEGAPSVFVLSLKAGGTGLTLTRANHVIHYDRWWNPAVEDQATDRAFRIGQQRNVQVHKLLVSGTLEERIDEMIERKIGIAADVVGSGEGWLTELSNDALRKLLQLGADALGD
jgi:superfamily II DNA or RNA helicase